MSFFTTYNCNVLTGGGVRALDRYSVDDLETGDRAICSVGGKFYYFVYDAEGVEAEQVADHPYIVRPDDYDTGGNWIETMVSFPLELDANGDLMPVE